MTAEVVERRPVRVTIEGVARPMRHDPRYMVVMTEAQSILILENGPGVTVEDIAPTRVWTDGDVVQSKTDLVYTRMNGEWVGRTPTGGLLGPWTDAATSTDVASGFLRVLRYQAGEL